MTTDLGRTLCIATTKYKDAALYFDHVLPVLGTALINKEELPITSTPGLKTFYRSLLPEDWFDESRVNGLTQEADHVISNATIASGLYYARYTNNSWNDPKKTLFFKQMLNYISEFEEKLGIKPPFLLDEPDIYLSSEQTFNNALELGLTYYEDLCLQHLSPLTSSQKLETQLLTSQVGIAPSPDGDPAFILSNIQPIDTTNLTWETIYALREDEDAIRKLRNLKLFLTKEYQGKEGNVEFVRDDLERRIEEYEETAKSWHLELRDTAIGAFLSREVLAFSASAISIVFGMPYAEIAQIATGTQAIGKLGSAMVELKNLKREHRRFAATNPIAYLIQAQEKQT